MKRNNPGFTIVELLVVIVVIAILATITIVSYTGITQKALNSSLQSNLNNASKLIKMYEVQNGEYPAILADANDGNGVPSSPDTIYQYNSQNSNNPKTFCLTATKATQSYNINQDGLLSSGGKNIVSSNWFYNVTKISDRSYRASTWGYTLLTNTTVLSIFKPSTTYHIKAKFTLEAKSALPVYSYTVAITLYSASTGQFYIASTNTMTNVGDTYNVDTTFTTPSSLGDKQMLSYTQRYTDGTNVELGTVLVEDLKIEEGSTGTCWTPAD